jgi:hypothetical protein
MFGLAQIPVIGCLQFHVIENQFKAALRCWEEKELISSSTLEVWRLIGLQPSWIYASHEFFETMCLSLPPGSWLYSQICLSSLWWEMTLAIQASIVPGNLRKHFLSTIHVNSQESSGQPGLGVHTWGVEADTLIDRYIIVTGGGAYSRNEWLQSRTNM